MLRPPATLLAVVLLCAGCAEIPQTDTAVQAGYDAESGDKVSLPLTDAIAKLPIADEVESGYEREKFNHWIDADSDCQDTRTEVLLAESTTKARGKCEVTKGTWTSSYDGVTLKRPGGLDIDHMVPLKEGWESGADQWTSDMREAYANDLGDPRALVAVTAASNRSKSDQDPADWMPDAAARHCTYVADWVAVKIRWSLSADSREQAALADNAADCGNPTVTVRLAQGASAPTDPDPSSPDPASPAPTTPAPTTPAPTTSAPDGGSSGNDPRFDTCGKAIDEGYGPYEKGSDPEYDWYRDGDGDGTVCDS